MMEGLSKNDDGYELTAAELDFLDWYDMLDTLQQAVVDLLISRATQECKGFLEGFRVNPGLSHPFNSSLAAAA